MNGLDECAVGAPQTPQVPQTPEQQPEQPPLYTRYCAAPKPAHPVGEPRIIHSLLVATWLGRLVDALPHTHHKN